MGLGRAALAPGGGGNLAHRLLEVGDPLLVGQDAEDVLADLRRRPVVTQAAVQRDEAAGEDEVAREEAVDEVAHGKALVGERVDVAARGQQGRPDDGGRVAKVGRHDRDLLLLLAGRQVGEQADDVLERAVVAAVEVELESRARAGLRVRTARAPVRRGPREQDEEAREGRTSNKTADWPTLTETLTGPAWPLLPSGPKSISVHARVHVVGRPDLNPSSGTTL